MLASEEPITIRSSPLGCALAPAAVANQSRTSREGPYGQSRLVVYLKPTIEWAEPIPKM
jgi:hypothetical protein